MVSGIFCNERMMLSHWVAFLCAAVISTLADVMYLIGQGENTQKQETYDGFYIAYGVLHIVAICFWKYVQFLILVVILKYGRPIQEDMKVLMATKLVEESAQREPSTSLLRFKRRHEAYKEIADR